MSMKSESVPAVVKRIEQISVALARFWEHQVITHENARTHHIHTRAHLLSVRVRLEPLTVFLPVVTEGLHDGDHSCAGKGLCHKLSCK